MTRVRKLLPWILVAALAVAALAYLHDPPWAGAVTSGLRAWTEDGGARFRWTNGHASFYVPSGAAWMRLRLRPGVARAQGTVHVHVAVDGRPAAVLRLDDVDRWESVVVPLARKTSRRFRRVELRVPEVRTHGNLGVQLGEVELGGR